MNTEKKNCLRCLGEGYYSGVYGRTVCGDCDGTGKVSAEQRKAQLKIKKSINKEVADLKEKSPVDGIPYVNLNPVNFSNVDEAAEKWWDENYKGDVNYRDDVSMGTEGFRAGAKWYASQLNRTDEKIL